MGGEHEKAGGFMRPTMVKERADFLKSGQHRVSTPQIFLCSPCRRVPSRHDPAGTRRAATLFVAACHSLSVGRRVVPTFWRRMQENRKVTDLITLELRKSVKYPVAQQFVPADKNPFRRDTAHAARENRPIAPFLMLPSPASKTYREILATRPEPPPPIQSGADRTCA